MLPSYIFITATIFGLTFFNLVKSGKSPLVATICCLLWIVGCIIWFDL